MLDSEAASAFFPDNASAIGQVLMVGRMPLEVIGVASQTSAGPGPSTPRIFVPYTTVAMRITGQTAVDSIPVRVRDDADMAAAGAGIEALLTERHGKKDFFLMNSDTIRSSITSTTRTLMVLISSIAIISLVVGGIGVMNIMLVSVTERTREIGVRMAVGARRSGIVAQFLTEAVPVCLLGGLLGVGLALGGGALLGAVAGGPAACPFGPHDPAGLPALDPDRLRLRLRLPARPRAWTRWMRSAGNRRDEGAGAGGPAASARGLHDCRPAPPVPGKRARTHPSWRLRHGEGATAWPRCRRSCRPRCYRRKHPGPHRKRPPMTRHSAPRVYLAGPEVFLPDALAVLKEKAALARAAGFDPVTPLDNESPPQGSPFDTGLAIYRANVGLMDGCDLIIANLTPFRGVGADPGTAFELGYMAARGARVAAYTNRATSHFERIRDEHYLGQVTRDPAGEHRGPDGLALENFGMFDNLMLAGAIVESGGILVTHEVEDSRLLYRDLTAFRRCLESL